MKQIIVTDKAKIIGAFLAGARRPAGSVVLGVVSFDRHAPNRRFEQFDAALLLLPSGRKVAYNSGCEYKLEGVK